MNRELTRIVVGQTGGGWGCMQTGCFQNLAPGASYEEGRQAEEPPLAQPEDLGEEVSRGVSVVEQCQALWSSTVIVALVLLLFYRCRYSGALLYSSTVVIVQCCT